MRPFPEGTESDETGTYIPLHHLISWTVIDTYQEADFRWNADSTIFETTGSAIHSRESCGRYPVRLTNMTQITWILVTSLPDLTFWSLITVVAEITQLLNPFKIIKIQCYCPIAGHIVLANCFHINSCSFHRSTGFIACQKKKNSIDGPRNIFEVATKTFGTWNAFWISDLITSFLR